MIVSISDANGEEMESMHDTPYSSRKEGRYITFNSRIDIKTKISDFSPGEAWDCSTSDLLLGDRVCHIL